MPRADQTPAPDRVWARLRHNAGVILGGRAVFGLVNLAAAAIAVRAVGLEAFGIVALMQAYVRVIAGLIRFESWAAVTRYGAVLMERGEDDALRRLLGFTLRLDALAFALSVAVAALAAPYAARLLDWPPEVAALAPWYAVSIVFITGATPTGFLRLIDRFRVLAGQHALNALIRLGGAALILWFGGGVVALVVVWALAGILSGAWMIWIALSEARARGLMPRLRGSWSELGDGFPNIWRFVAITNANGLIETVIGQGTVLAVGAVLGTTGASLFALVRQLTDALKKLGGLLAPIVFPEIAALAARGDSVRIGHLLWRSVGWAGLLVSGIVAALALGGGPLLAGLFGEEARAAAPLLLAAGAAAGLDAAGFAVVPVLLSIGRETSVLRTAVIVAVPFLPLLLVLTALFGLLGAGLALLAHQVALQGLRFALARAALRPAGRGA